MERQNETPERGDRTTTGGAANTPRFPGESPAVRSAADHQIPEETGGGMSAAGRGAGSETEKELERTRDLVAERAAPVMAEKTQEALQETARNVAGDPEIREQVKRTASAVQEDAGRMARDRMGAIAQRAEDRVTGGMKQAAERIEDAAHRLDRVAEERTADASGATARAGEMAHTVADTMESVARYLRENDARGLRQDLERQVREKPLQTLLVGLAAGWVAGKILR